MAQSGEPLRLFLTVGSQMPFDRLVTAVAGWAESRPGVKVVAQIGASSLGPDDLHPMEVFEHLSPPHYLHHFGQSHLVVAHAGMGSILTALDLGRPLVVMPRRGHRAETRNDHQLDTARHLMDREAFGARMPVRVALDETVLPSVLDQSCDDLRQGRLGERAGLTYTASDSHAALIRCLHSVVMGSALP